MCLFHTTPRPIAVGQVEEKPELPPRRGPSWPEVSGTNLIPSLHCPSDLTSLEKGPSQMILSSSGSHRAGELARRNQFRRSKAYLGKSLRFCFQAEYQWCWFYQFLPEPNSLVQPFATSIVACKPFLPFCKAAIGFLIKFSWLQN